jgi:hypothetical protein
MNELIISVLTAGVLAGGRSTSLQSAVFDAFKLYDIIHTQVEKQNQNVNDAFMQKFAINTDEND